MNTFILGTTLAMVLAVMPGATQATSFCIETDLPTADLHQYITDGGQWLVVDCDTVVPVATPTPEPVTTVATEPYMDFLDHGFAYAKAQKRVGDRGGSAISHFRAYYTGTKNLRDYLRRITPEPCYASEHAAILGTAESLTGHLKGILDAYNSLNITAMRAQTKAAVKDVGLLTKVDRWTADGCL